MYHSSNKCVNTEYDPCDTASDNACAGVAHMNYVYEIGPGSYFTGIIFLKVFSFPFLLLLESKISLKGHLDTVMSITSKISKVQKHIFCISNST